MSGAEDRSAHGESGTLLAIRWDVRPRPVGPSVTLAMEAEGDRYAARLEGEANVLAALYLLLGPQIGRPLATIGSLTMDTTR